MFFSIFHPLCENLMYFVIAPISAIGKSSLYHSPLYDRSEDSIGVREPELFGLYQSSSIASSMNSKGVSSITMPLLLCA